MVARGGPAAGRRFDFETPVARRMTGARISERRSSAGLRASRNRTAGPPPAHHELPSIMVGAVHAAAGAARGTLLSAAGDPRAAKLRPRDAPGCLSAAA